MRILLTLLLTALAAIAGTQFFMDEPGHVMVSWSGWVIETSLAFAVLALLVAVLAIWFALRFLFSALLLPARIAAWRRHRRVAGGRRALVRGLIEMAEGRWDRAEKQFLRAARDERPPLICHLSAARAAQRQGAHDRRDGYLHAAIESDPKSEVAVAFTQAELQIEAGQDELALATLNRLDTLLGAHPHLLRLKATLAGRMGDADALLEMTPQLRRHKVFAPDEIGRMERGALLQRIARCVEQGDSARLESLWQGLSRDLAADPEVAAALGRGLLRTGEPAKAAAALRASLKRDYSGAVMAVFGRVPHEDPAAMLAWAERFLKGHEQDAALLLALGRLARGARLWGKARTYIEASIGRAPSVESYRELAELLDRMGGPEEARDACRKGLRLALEGEAGSDR